MGYNDLMRQVQVLGNAVSFLGKIKIFQQTSCLSPFHLEFATYLWEIL